MNEESAVEKLADVKDTFERHNVLFWLDCGTLLGAIRDNKIITWDNDLDIGMWYKDLDKIKEAVKEFKKKEYLVQYRNINNEYIPVGLMIDDIEIEFLIHNPKEDGKHYYDCIMPIHIVGKFFDYILWCFRLNSPKVKQSYGSMLPYKFTCKAVNICNTLPKRLRERIIKIIENLYLKIDSVIIESAVPVEYFKMLKKITFYGLDFYIPYDTEKYLEFRFGDWKNPSKYYYGGAVVRKYRYGNKKIADKHIWGG